MREFGVRSLKQVMTAWQQMQVPGVLGDDHHKHSRSGTLKKRHWSMAMSAEDGSDFEDLQSPLKCCRGFQWEEDTKSCTACLYPGYGRGCRLRCNCSETDCSRYIGCKIVSRTDLTTLHTAGTYTGVLRLPLFQRLSTNNSKTTIETNEQRINSCG
ncbi:uncharacterized protein LOC111138437 isoform X2 [Crassostrea virginica]